MWAWPDAQWRMLIMASFERPPFSYKTHSAVTVLRRGMCAVSYIAQTAKRKIPFCAWRKTPHCQPLADNLKIVFGKELQTVGDTGFEPVTSAV